jgi:hypothetical protein
MFQRFREVRPKLNPEKCQPFQKEERVQYLGHIVSPEGKTTDPEKLKDVREWPTPKNEYEIRSFLGLCTNYGRFISGSTNVTKPLPKLTEEKQAFQWTPEVEAAVEQQEVPNKEGAVQTIGALEDQYQDGHTAPPTGEETDTGRWWVPNG